jgi:glutathione S-transferase
VPPEATLLLWNSPVSGNCYKVRLLLSHLGRSYLRREVSVTDRSNRAELLRGKNPALRVPVLELDGERTLAESNAILWYLGEGTRYVPVDPWQRAKVLQWLFFEQYSHEPYIAVARFWLAYSGEPERYRSQLDDKLAGGYRALDAMEEELRAAEFLVADRYTIADIALYAYTHAAPEGGFDLGGYPAIRAWLARVAEQPGHVPIDA